MREQIAQAERLEIKPKILPQLLRTIFRIACAALLISIATGSDLHPGIRLSFIFIATILFLIAVLSSIRMMLHRPVLIIEPAGFQMPLEATGLVRWDGVAFLRVRYSHRPRIIVALHPGAALSLVPTRLRRIALALRIARRDHLALRLARLGCPPAHVIALLKDRLSAEVGDASLSAPPLPARRRSGEIAAPAPSSSWPLFGVCLAALLIGIFAIELALSQRDKGALDIDVRTLVALGGNLRNLTVDRLELWRLVTSSLLHVDPLHLLFNIWALIIAARLLEPTIGPRWFAAVFALSALGGGMFSDLLNPPNIVSVGASGGIVGLAAATMIVALHFQPGFQKSRLMTGSLGILIPSLLPFLGQLHVGGGRIDIADHVGFLWEGRDRPRFGHAGLAIASSFFLVAAASAVGIGDTLRLNAALAPDLPQNTAAAKALSATLIVRYPRDPRVRYDHALLALDRHDLATARHDLESAMADHDMLGLTPGLDPYLRGLLAQVLVSDGHDRAAAKRLVDGHCPAIVAVYGSTIGRFGFCSDGERAPPRLTAPRT